LRKWIQLSHSGAGGVTGGPAVEWIGFDLGQVVSSLPPRAFPCGRIVELSRGIRAAAIEDTGVLAAHRVEVLHPIEQTLDEQIAVLLELA